MCKVSKAPGVAHGDLVRGVAPAADADAWWVAPASPRRSRGRLSQENSQRRQVDKKEIMKTK